MGVYKKLGKVNTSASASESAPALVEYAWCVVSNTKGNKVDSHKLFSSYENARIYFDYLLDTKYRELWASSGCAFEDYLLTLADNMCDGQEFFIPPSLTDQKLELRRLKFEGDDNEQSSEGKETAVYYVAED